MKKVLGYGASRAAQTANYVMSSGPSVVAHEKEAKEVEEACKDRDKHANFLSDFTRTLEQHTQATQKSIESGRTWADLLRGYDLEAAGLASSFQKVGEFAKSVAILQSDLNELIVGFNQYVIELLTTEIKESRETKASYEKIATMYDTSCKKIKQYEKGKVKLEQLKELEDERNKHRQAFKKSAEETKQVIDTLNNKCSIELLAKLCDLMSYYEDFFRQGSEFMKSQVVPEVKELRGQLADKDTQNKSVPRWNFVTQTKKSRTGSDFLKNRQTQDPADIALYSSLLSKMTKRISFEVMKERPKIGAKKKRLLHIDLEDLSIAQSRSNNEHKKIHEPGTLLGLDKSIVNSKKLRVTWNWTEVREEFIFSSAEQRERFCEYVNFIKLGVLGKPIKSIQDIDIFVGAWNMGEASPPSNLDDWIPKHKYDLYCISTQECEYAPEKGHLNCESAWFGHVTTHLGSNYIKIAGLSLLSIRMIVLIKRDYFYNVSQLETATVATGIGGVIGNKGAVAISLRLNETNICFIGAHLAARQEEWENRNANYRDIIRGLKIGRKPLDVIHQFDHVFFCGDLNYRLDIPRDNVLELIKKGSFDILLKGDQLRREHTSGNVLNGFQEGNILFPPTYRYNRGDRTYSSEKNRIPSWCDRILWKSLPSNNITQTAYGCVDTVTTSDHSPIFAVFNVKTLLPNPPVSKDPVKIVFKNLRGMQLRAADHLGASSNPYVVFHTSFMDGTRSTDVCSQTLEPSWSDSQVPPLLPFVYHEEYLKQQHVVVQVKHKSHLKEDEEIGQGTIALSNAFGEASQFSVGLWYKGRKTGTLTGTIQVSVV